MTAPAHTVTMHLVSTPFPHMALRARATPLPLSSDNDFAMFAAIPRNHADILVLHPHHHQLIADLVGRLLQWDPALDAILLTMKMPAHIRLPGDLLDERVFMMGDVRFEEAALPETGRRMVVIDNGILSAPFEKGDNRLSVRLYNMDDAREAGAVVEQVLGERGMRAGDRG